MLKQKAQLISSIAYVTEIILVIVAFLMAYSARDIYLSKNYGNTPVLFAHYIWLIFVIIPLWSFLFYYFDFYVSQRTNSFLNEVWKIANISFFGTIFLICVLFSFKAHSISRLAIFLFGIISFLSLVVERGILRVVARRLRKRGYNYRNILIVGTGQRARDIETTFSKYKHWGMNLIGFVVDPAEEKTEPVLKSPILGVVYELPQLLEKYVVDELIFTVSKKSLDALEDIFLLCEMRGITTRIDINFFPHKISRAYMEELHGIPLLTFTTTPYNEARLLLKRLFDLLVASLVLILCCPVFLLIGLLIKATSEGPILFRQVRVGLNGRQFVLYKFRSMVQNAEEMKRHLKHLNEMDGPVFKIKNDPRVTPIGWFLRRSSLDEFPQFYNVLRGDMSIVGPRPHSMEDVEKYQLWHRRRLSIKPGVTGFWQINGRNKVVDFKDLMGMDLHYIDNWSLELDFKIFIKTIFVVLSGKGAC